MSLSHVEMFSLISPHALTLCLSVNFIKTVRKQSEYKLCTSWVVITLHHTKQHVTKQLTSSILPPSGFFLDNYDRGTQRVSNFINSAYKLTIEVPSGPTSFQCSHTPTLTSPSQIVRWTEWMDLKTKQLFTVMNVSW